MIQSLSRRHRPEDILDFEEQLIGGNLVHARPNVRVEAGPASKPQARKMENSASPLCGPGVLMLGLASNEGLGLAGRSVMKAIRRILAMIGLNHSGRAQSALPMRIDGKAWFEAFMATRKVSPPSGAQPPEHLDPPRQ